MARTYLSVLTENKHLEFLLKKSIHQSGYSIGFVGNDEKNLTDYLKVNDNLTHLLFVKPTIRYTTAYNERKLLELCTIDVIIVGSPLLDIHVALIQDSHISGYILQENINQKEIFNLVNQIYRHGYYASTEIPKSFWMNRPKRGQRLPKPKFTKREIQVLDKICHGFTNLEIATIIKSSVSNVNNHLERIKSKIHVESSKELIGISISNNWVVLSREKYKRHNPFIKY